MTLNRVSFTPGETKEAASTAMPASVARALESAQTCLRSACLALVRWDEPPLDLDEMARALSRAFSALFDAVDGRGDRARAFSVFCGALDSVEIALSPYAQGNAAAAELIQLARRSRSDAEAAKDWLALQQSGADAEPFLTASGDRPRVFSLARNSFSPVLRVAPAPPPAPAPEEKPTPKAASFEELHAAVAALKGKAAQARKAKAEAEASNAIELPKNPVPAAIPEGFARAPQRGMEPLAYVRARTREWFEEIAMVGMQRAPLLGEPFRTALGLERRMVRAIDGIAAFGPAALSYLPVLAMDFPIPDPARIFALTMALGCAAGRDALAIAEFVLLSCEPGDEAIGAFGNAMKLVPHQNVLESLRSFLSESGPSIRAMAVDALGFRGLLSPEDLSRAMDDADECVRAQAILHAAPLKDAALPSRLLSLSRAESAPCRNAAKRALVQRGDLNITVVLEEALSREPPEELDAILFALAADEPAARRFVDMCRKRPSAAGATALGWLGACNSIELLISFLESEDEALRLASAWALERITGAGLWEGMPAPEAEIDVQEPQDPELNEPPPPLARMVSDPHDRPPEPSAEMVEQPSLNPMRWKAYWMEMGADYEYSGRYRMGRRYSPSVVLAELDTARRTMSERRLLQIELAARTGGWVRFDPHDWVAAQEESLRAWQPIAAKNSSQPGTWAFAWGGA